MNNKIECLGAFTYLSFSSSIPFLSMGSILSKHFHRRRVGLQHPTVLSARSPSADSNLPIGFKWIDGPGLTRAAPPAYLLSHNAEESDRLDQQHYLLRFIFDGNHMAPLKEQLRRGIQVLDAGCGSGCWSIEMAKQYPAIDTDGWLHGGPHTTELYAKVRAMYNIAGINPEVVHTFDETLKSIGLENIEHNHRSVPVGWGPEEIATLSAMNIEKAMRSAKKHMTRVLRMGNDEFDEMIIHVAKEFAEYQVHWHVFYALGRKPLATPKV
ncbi:hypothetical protein BC938DRAFT_481226 [Jimgerdemannia flammicorona]|uniref:Methyltransferase domain-containing protein n=1 Tax=Jimgerdemannia flammicorona TaxID=994334 RepID=A0A433QWY2_9FUNG|nr:hypothetical protein BC938DRAFT_481226 [Jimgerdemannia flammicorona]